MRASTPTLERPHRPPASGHEHAAGSEAMDDLLDLKALRTNVGFGEWPEGWECAEAVKGRVSPTEREGRGSPHLQV